MTVEKSPDAYRTIGEVAEELELPQHVLRFWETKFTQIRPMKRGGGRRYYRPVDVALLKGIRRLLYEDGYTIRGVQRIIRERGARQVAALGGAEAAVPSEDAPARDTDVRVSHPTMEQVATPAGRTSETSRAHDNGSHPARPPAGRGPATRPDPAPARPAAAAASSAVSDPQTRAALEGVLSELLACKRLLDGAD